MTVVAPFSPSTVLASCSGGWNGLMSQTTHSGFDADLLTLRSSLSEMGGLAEEQLDLALASVRRRDPALARRVIEGDAVLDQRENALEEQAIRMLALRQPLAQDLRETIAALKIASTLERIGDLAKNIAKRASAITEGDRPQVDDAILRMGKLAQSQLAETLDAYGARDTNLAVAIWRRDVEIDELYNSLFRELIGQMTQNPRLVSHGAQFLFIAKNLERVGDHTTFIAEMTYYVVVGQSLGDDRPKGDLLFDTQDYASFFKQ